MTQLVSVGEVRLQIINPRIRHDFFIYGILDASMLDGMIQGLLQMNFISFEISIYTLSDLGVPISASNARTWSIWPDETLILFSARELPLPLPYKRKEACDGSFPTY